jgi:inner membrane protein
VLGHTIGFAILISVVAGIFARQKLKTRALACLSFHLHLLGDLIGARSRICCHFRVTWRCLAWPMGAQCIITGALLGFTLIMARQQGFSPLEMLSSKADSVLSKRCELVFR